MVHDPAEPPVRPPAALPALITALLPALLLVVLLALTGCSALGDGDEPVATPVAGAGAADELERLLDRRARAVRRGDRAAYVATVGRGDPRARRLQLRLFDNLVELPLARYRHDLDPASLVRAGDGVVAEVVTVTQLEGFDAVPVRTPGLVRFTASGPDGAFRVASHRDAAWARGRGVLPQPWELARTEVLRADGVLVVTDEATAARVAGLAAAVEQAALAVAPLVPYPWDRSVVVYALGDTRVLARLPEVPGGDPEQLDGVSVPVRARWSRGPLASTRVVLHPRMLDRGSTTLGRLLRHELVHVALAARDDAVPTWLAEGIAEWVSVQALPVADRTIARAAVAAALQGVDALPSDETFNEADSAANYGVAWWAVEHVARAYGAESVWALLDRFAEAGAAGREQGRAVSTDAVLLEVLGLTEAQLASAAGRGIVATFG